MATKSLVPFSPVPTHHVEIRRKGHPAVDDGPWSESTFIASPMAELWESNYRSAALQLVFGHDEKARYLARLGMDLEDAYLSRSFEEHRTEKATVPA
ncbi:hypothetical protein EFK50_16605 [Nocardioides marmoriginsengisoli]|uniref:Uncharacterized protein n=1 Tax=Nocardioides marmoriginsengisoli TaxID=661483 RepID=A0A3N0CC26_9ACTN|nr:hypothetical protein [Nocardioides marmoriginsengisoli]RNL61007.1 hypothetical protein EFK50_16605 [Nocardioides marmoriginsengisoli]